MKTLLILTALVLPLLANAQAQDGFSDGHLSDYYPTLAPSQAPPQKDDVPQAWYDIDAYPACKPVYDASSLITFYAPEYKKVGRAQAWVQSLKSEAGS